MSADGRRARIWAGLRGSALFGTAMGVLYGLFARAAFGSQRFGLAFALLTLSFMVVVPGVIGYLAVYPSERPSWFFRIFAPWLPCVLVVLVAAIVGWEGAICIVMSLPLLLIFSSIGGIAAVLHTGRRPGHAAVLAVLPFAIAPLERQLPQPVRVERNETSIVVDADVDAVWREVIEVRTITEAEQRNALYTRLGFPRPISAELSRPGFGGIRHARFEGGVLFIETITAWEEGRRIAFTIDAQTDSIPATTLDPHVTIGGEYFDVLSGEYVLHPLENGQTRVELTSRHRLSTHLNPYAGWWAGLVMRSIQDNILSIVRERAERGAGGPSGESTVAAHTGNTEIHGATALSDSNRFGGGMLDAMSWIR